jgi:UDP-glucose 4-epimerase
VTGRHRLAERFAGTRCVVTGGLGFIGSNVVHALAGMDADVVVIDGAVPAHGGNQRNLDDLARPVRTIVSDIGETDRVGPVVRGADFVFNLAGQVSHLASMLDPRRDLELNVASHAPFLEALRAECPGASIVYSSTRQVYGRPQYLPVDESHPTNPVDVNGISKLACEQLHLLYATVHGMNVTALRLTNVYGPRQRLTTDDLGFLPVFVRRALDGETLKLFGDGTQLRDCLYIDDVVDALLLAVVTPDARGEVINLGHTDALSLREIACHTNAAAGSTIDVELVPWPDDRARIDIGSFRGDFAKAKRVLGWEPETSFPDGVARTVAFYRGRPWYRSSI